MMDRLTYRAARGAVSKYNPCTGCVQPYTTCRECMFREFAELLAAGRLIELPCAVGDTVWEVRWWDKVTESKVIDGKTYFRKVRKRKVTKTQFSLFDYNDFGKIVFLTKAEAEAALKEREEE